MRYDGLYGDIYRMLEDMIERETKSSVENFLKAIPPEPPQNAYGHMGLQAIKIAYGYGINKTTELLEKLQKNPIHFMFLPTAAELYQDMDFDGIMGLYNLAGGNALARCFDEGAVGDSNIDKGVKLIVKDERVKGIIGAEKNPLDRAYLTDIAGQGELNYALQIPRDIAPEDRTKWLRKLTLDIDFYLEVF